MSRWFLICFLLIPNITSADELKIKNFSLGYSPLKGHVAVGGIKVPTEFNNYSFRLNVAQPSKPLYYLGLELNLLKNQSDFNTKNLLAVFGFNTPLNEAWTGQAELKLGWGMMQDQGALYKIESLEGLVLGASFGGTYRPQLNQPYFIGINIIWSHQMHGDSWWGKNNSSDTVIDQWGPQFNIGYEF